jgi:tetratricopeptide (TPR) repeat protein/CHAT domain-containing protein
MLLVAGINGHAQVDTYNELYTQFSRLKEANNYDSALLIAKEMNAWALKNESDTSLRYAVSFRVIGDCFKFLNKNDSAIQNYNFSIEFFKTQHRERHPEYASSLHYLGIVYKNLGDYNFAEQLYKQALEIRKNTLGVNHVDVARTLTNLANIYKYKGEFQLAENYYVESLAIYKESLGEEHPEVGMCLNNLGLYYFEMGDYKSAETLYTQSLDVRKKTLGEFHPDVAMSLNNFGGLYLERGDFKLALPFYEDALAIYKKAYGKNHKDIAMCLNNLGILFSKMGDYQSAESFYKESLEIRKKLQGEAHPDVARNLNSLGVFYNDLGEYKSAESFLKRALAIRLNLLGQAHPDVASTLNNLGNLYKNMGDYESAIKLYQQAMETFKNAYGENHIEYATSLNNLGGLFCQMGQFKTAELKLNQSLEIRKKNLGEEHPDVAMSLNNLAFVYGALGDFKSAKLFYTQSMNIRKGAFGEEHPLVAESLHNLGSLSNSFRDYVSAETYLSQSLNLKKKTYGEAHPFYINAINALAYLYIQTKRDKEAYQVLNTNFSIKVKVIVDNFEWLSEKQKEAYWNNEKYFFDQLSWFAHKAYLKVPEAVGLNYNATLSSKGKLLETKIANDQFMGAIPEVDSLREELAYRRRLLAKMESDGSTDKERLDKLHHEADSLDKRLTMSWPEYAQQKKNLSITWDQVQEQLAPGEAAIEFVRFENEDDSLVYYNALVLRKEDTQPQLIKLCKEKDLEGIAPKMGFSAYYPLVWQPMEEVLKGISTIYYAPTGLLTNIPFPALYAPSGSGDVIAQAKTDKRGVVIENEHAKTEENATFLMDRYTLHQLTSTRYLAMGLKQKSTEPIAKDMAMVGGVNYDYLPGTTAAVKSSKKKKNAQRSSESANGKLGYLEGTKTEVEQINSSVGQSSWSSTILSGNAATEENIVQFEGKNAKSILHLATHGYAFPEFDYNDTTISKNSFRYSFRYSQNPMVRSGLILSGGNWAWTGSDTLTSLGAEQNGILTAEEVAQLNLKKTKLVVLSACETGLGKIDGSEGTFGLKRGFKLAGVEQMIVSLWSVPDKETMELMTLFYTDLTKTLNPVKSFSNAQKEMRNKYPTEPEKWAGFVMVR